MKFRLLMGNNLIVMVFVINIVVGLIFALFMKYNDEIRAYFIPLIVIVCGIATGFILKFKDNIRDFFKKSK